MQAAANAALMAIATVGALNGLLRPHFGLRYHALSEFVPRLLLGAILVNTALCWVQFAVDVNNALAASVGNATPPNWNNLNGAHQTLTDIVLGLVYVIVGLLLLLQMLMRLAWIDVLLVISPLAVVVALIVVQTVVIVLTGAKTAETWLGVPYVFGGCSRAGIDSSCLVRNVYAAVGIRLPRVAVDQFNATTPTSDPQTGDLVFFANTYQPGISHVGIYIGNGLQINAPTTGEVVSVAPVRTGYWGAHYAGTHRVGG
jgi:hypothetical protein